MAVMYLCASLVLESWNPKDWTAAAKSLFGVTTEQGGSTDGEQGSQGKPSDTNTPTGPTQPSDPEAPETPTEPAEPVAPELTPEAQNYIDEVNAVLDALDTINYDSELMLTASLKYAELSESDTRTQEVQTAMEALTLIQDNSIYDGYWWAPLETRKVAAAKMQIAGLRTDSGELKEHAHPSSVPLTTEAQKFIDAVNAVIDKKDLYQSDVIVIPYYKKDLGASDLKRRAVSAANKACTIIVNEVIHEGSGKYSLPLDARLEAANIMIAAGLRTDISWIE